MAIKKEANMLLIGIIIVLLLGIIGMAVFFQQLLMKVSNDYATAQQQIADLKQSLEFQMNRNFRLNETLHLLEEKYKGQRGEIEQVFHRFEQEKQNLSSSLNATQQVLQQTKQNLAQTQAELTSLQYQYHSLNQRLTQINASYLTLQATVAEAKNMTDETVDLVNALYVLVNDYIDNNETTMDALQDLRSDIKKVRNIVRDLQDMLE